MYLQNETSVKYSPITTSSFPKFKDNIESQAYWIYIFLIIDYRSSLDVLSAIAYFCILK